MKNNCFSINLTKLILVITALFIGAGCSQISNLKSNFTNDTTLIPTCADRAIENAFNLYGEAKSGLALFYEEHSDNRLYQAYYAAWDSVNEARKVKKCWDRRVSHYHAMQNIQDMNVILARVIRRNMPDDDSGELIAVYREQYERVMPTLP